LPHTHTLSPHTPHIPVLSLCPFHFYLISHLYHSTARIQLFPYSVPYLLFLSILSSSISLLL
jgi:hypothetical protein